MSIASSTRVPPLSISDDGDRELLATVVVRNLKRPRHRSLARTAFDRSTARLGQQRRSAGVTVVRRSGRSITGNPLLLPPSALEPISRRPESDGLKTAVRTSAVLRSSTRRWMAACDGEFRMSNLPLPVNIGCSGRFGGESHRGRSMTTPVHDRETRAISAAAEWKPKLPWLIGGPCC